MCGVQNLALGLVSGEAGDMNRTLLSVLMVSTVGAAACAKAPTVATGSGLVAVLARDVRAKPAPQAPAPVQAAAAADVPALVKTPGDFVVLRYSGSYRTAPVVLTERVLMQDGGTTTMELSLAEGKKTLTLRARLRGERVLDVVRVENGAEHSAPIALYDAMMQKTMPDVDVNEETLGTEETALNLGGNRVGGTTTRYKIRVGGKPATMSIFHADGFAWGDVAGEISGADGKAIYKAEVVEVGNAKSATASR